MANDVVCPWCGSRRPEAEVTQEDVGGRPEWGAYWDCQAGCVAGGFDSGELHEAVERGDPEALQAVRRSIGVNDQAKLEWEWKDITGTDPPRRLRWARQPRGG